MVWAGDLSGDFGQGQSAPERRIQLPGEVGEDGGRQTARCLPRSEAAQQTGLYLELQRQSGTAIRGVAGDRGVPRPKGRHGGPNHARAIAEWGSEGGPQARLERLPGQAGEAPGRLFGVGAQTDGSRRILLERVADQRRANLGVPSGIQPVNYMTSPLFGQATQMLGAS